MRIVVVGTSGAGKTTLARGIGVPLELPHIELDAINWQSGWCDLTQCGTKGAIGSWGASKGDPRDMDAQISVLTTRLTPETINRISTARRKLTSLIRR